MNTKTTTGRTRQYLYTLRSRVKTKQKLDRAGNPIECHLSLQDVEQLLTEAGITIWDLGRKRTDYCLARYDDTGHYEIGNCRFITQQENRDEWWNALTPEQHQQRIERNRQRGRSWWDRMTPEEQQAHREASRAKSLARWNAYSPEEQQAIIEGRKP